MNAACGSRIRNNMVHSLANLLCHQDTWGMDMCVFEPCSQRYIVTVHFGPSEEDGSRAWE